MRSLSVPRFRAYLGATSAWFGWGRPVALRIVGPLSGPLPCPGAFLLEHLIRYDEERWGYRDPQRLSGLEVDG
jgi:hypothetical protein